MAEPSDKTKNSAGKMSLGGIGKSLLGGAKKFAMWNLRHNTGNLFNKNSSSELVDKNHMPPAKVLGEIYKMMKIMDEDKKLNHEMVNSHLESEELKKDIRNKEIIKALTGRRKKKPVTPRKRKAKKEEEPTPSTGKGKGKEPEKGKEPDKVPNKADDAKRNADAKKAEADRKTKEAKDAADAKKAENDRAAQERATKREKEEQEKAAAKQKQLEKEKQKAKEDKDAADKKAGEAQTEAEKRAATRAQEEANRKVAETERKAAEEAKARAKTEAERKAAEEERKRLAEEERKRLAAEAEKKRLAEAEKKKLKDEETAKRIKDEEEAARKAQEAATAEKNKPATPAKPVEPPKPPATPMSSSPIIPIVGGVAAAVSATEVMARIKQKEGFYETAYPDPKDQTEKYSVGHGHQITPEEWKRGYILVGNKKIPTLGKNGDKTVISKEDAAALLALDYPKYESYAKKLPNFDKLNKNAQMALIDMTYNLGVGWAHPHGEKKGWPGLLKQLESLEMDAAAENILGTPYAAQTKGRGKENAEFIRKGLVGLPTQQNVPTQNTTGNTLDAVSKENKDGKKSLMDYILPGFNKTNTTVINQQNGSPAKNSDSEDDTAEIFKKMFGTYN